MTLNDELLEQLGQSGLEQIAGLLGTDLAMARQVIEAATGAIVGGMARNARELEGAHALLSALDEHAQRNPFTADVHALSRDGQGILDHVLGEQGIMRVAAGISKFAGIDRRAIMRLLPLIAPMVMSLLADRVRRQDMDAGQVAGELRRETSAISNALGGLLNAVLGGFGDGPRPYPDETQ
ncbi:DUF937 domain-containing protein [Thermoactinospora rubra]|uniref:DUF937 domain-containing protein n=1 Tax=Thermoactinospora rubra TaxID=1088767 RepID=UPI001301C8DA|nr:DUF937 domain-containing protein [Thermoactinospora rubra]